MQQRALAMIGQEMTGFGVDWDLSEGRIRYGGLEVVAREHPEEPTPDGIGHIDIGIAFSIGGTRHDTLWDCAAGVGSTPEQALDDAIHRWAVTTGAALTEMVTQRGEHGGHLSAADSGLVGWHAIHSPVMGWGSAASVLLEWWQEHDVLPGLASALGPLAAVAPGAPGSVHGLKILFGAWGGEPTAEVRLDGVVHEPASRALASLGWPWPEPGGYVRAYVLLITDVVT